jgi:hypothetical protein
VRQDRFPKAGDLLPFVISGEMMKKLAVPEIHLVDGIVQADVKDIPVSEHAVHGKLNQQGGLPDAGMGKHGAEPPGWKDVLCLETKLAQRVAKDQFLFQHIMIPVLFVK